LLCSVSVRRMLYGGAASCPPSSDATHRRRRAAAQRPRRATSTALRPARAAQTRTAACRFDRPSGRGARRRSGAPGAATFDPELERNAPKRIT
jgi:hypothetical protein